MSKSINVNPDHYKVAGRERPGDGIVHDVRAKAPTDDRTRDRWQRRQKEKARARKGGRAE